MKLSDRGVLLTPSFRVWQATKLDKRASQQVTSDNDAYQGVARVNKTLLPGVQQYKDVIAKKQSIYLFVRRETLPYLYEGTFLCPTAKFMDVQRGWNQQVSEWQTVLETFYDVYPSLYRNAQIRLGKLWDEQDYPSVDTIAHRFSAELTVSPVPDVDSFYQALADDAAEEVAKEWEQVKAPRLEEVVKKDVYERLLTVVTKMHERIKDPAATFKDSLVCNLRDLVSEVDKLNITQDPTMDAIKQELMATVCPVSPDVLRSDFKARSETAIRTKELMDRLQGLI